MKKSPTVKKSSSKKTTKSKKPKSSNPAAMKNPPKRGGSVIKIEPEDIQEFKHRKKVANAIEHNEEYEDVDFSEESRGDEPQMYDEEGKVIY